VGPRAGMDVSEKSKSIGLEVQLTQYKYLSS
jgi:hypothetical protein